MSIDFSSYVAPGVFVEDNTIPLATSTGTVPAVVTIVGPALGYNQATVSIAVNATTPVIIDNDTAYAAGANAPVVTKVDGTTVLTSGVDYTASVDTNGDLNIVRIAASTNIANGDTVIVTYRWTPSTYYTVQQFFDYATVVEVFGQPLYQPAPGSVTTPPANQIVSPLSFAAKIAFENGANQLILLAADQRLGVSLKDALVGAYAKILTDQRVGIIVPLLFEVDGQGVTTILSSVIAEGYATDLKNHLLAASADGNPRIGILGMPNGFTTTGGYQNFADVATFLLSSRVVLAYPEAVLYFNGYTNTTLTIDGYYLAAAYAGRLAAIPVGKPLTHEVMSSFAGIPGAIQQIQTKAVKNALATAGVALVEVDRFNRLIVRHGLTTNYAGGLLAREISIIRQRDALFRLVEEGLITANLVGQAIDTGTPLAVKAVVSGILQQAVTTEIVQDYQNLAVRVRSTDPSVVEIKFSYQPAVPLNYIVVSFSLNVQTGATDLSLAA